MSVCSSIRAKHTIFFKLKISLKNSVFYFDADNGQLTSIKHVFVY